ncbi:MAG: methyltransferase domain-containing protein [Candidatus Diapherotrites archaeon]|nr:methyltransferase domain-containing protein [Candidatus Diapherotrites archaeon]
MDVEDYSDWAVQYYDRKVSSIIRSYLVSKKIKTILDCGCGDGNFLYALKSKNLLKGKKVYAIDLSKRRLEIVKKIDDGIIAKIDSAEELKTIKSSSIDLVVSMQVIEHVNDKKMALQLKRVLKKKGLAYISTIFKKKYAFCPFVAGGKRVIDPTHLREYVKDRELLGLFKTEEFKLIKQSKTPLMHSLFYPLFLFFSKDRFLFEKNLFAKNLDRIKIPFPRFYIWEVLLQKR